MRRLVIWAIALVFVVVAGVAMYAIIVGYIDASRPPHSIR